LEEYGFAKLGERDMARKLRLNQLKYITVPYPSIWMYLSSISFA